jgi:isoamylase/glycogen operon protein
VVYGKSTSPPLIDPYAHQLDVPTSWADFSSYQPRSVTRPRSPPPVFKHPRIPKERLIIYEMHIRGFTQDPSSNVKHPGTFLGVIEKIPYLLSLGVNAVKLLPVFEFDEREVKLRNPETGERLLNYWGYSPVHFFCPMRRYAVADPIAEFREMVHALHHAGIEVILDVVYNHTAEGNEVGPTYHFKGLAPSTYYLLDNNHEFLNFSGCGNSVNANHLVTYELILDSLRYWFLEMGVDGFRFDLAALLTRGDAGEVLSPPPIIRAIANDPLLRDVKLFAEPWDAAGLYQVAQFPHWDPDWSEWNGKFRDQVRAFIKGNPGLKGDFATRLCGSQDLYGAFSPENSLNFITAHDGFTLHDLVSYNQKHNWINGENDTDGSSFNDSWNCGVEGPTDLPDVLELRERQMKNYLIALMISLGIPMLFSGDEYAHTKMGNNNSWCQDNFLNWFDWSALNDSTLLPFLKKLIRIRNAHFIRNSFYSPQEIIWHGTKLHQPDWNNDSSFIAFQLPDQDLFCFFNASSSHVDFDMPSGNWQTLVSTSQNSNNAYSAAIFKKAPLH